MSNKNNHNSKNDHPSQPHRGGVWSTWLILLMLHGFGAGLLVYNSMHSEFANYTTIILPLLAIAAILQIISVVGMWNWKIWGLYMYVAVVFIQMAAHIVLTASVYVAFYDAIPLLITGYLINSQQRIKHFS
jgi:hypothetical protein